MSTLLQITFRQMDTSPALEQEVRESFAKLETRHPRLTSCRVVIQSPHRHHLHGRRFQVTLELGVPGHAIVVNHGHEDRDSHEDAHATVREAFQVATRALDEHDATRREARRGGSRAGSAGEVLKD